MARYVKFFLARNPDSDEMFWRALLGAGYVETDIAHADFVFDDCARGHVIEKVARRVPYFIVPHTPQSWFFWDWPRDEIPTRCNFVAGDAAVFGMKAYGYKRRVEAVGFSRCAVREFTPTKGCNLLVVPGHEIRGGGYCQPDYIATVTKMLNFIMDNRRVFGKVNVCWNAKLETRLSNKLRAKHITVTPTNPYVDKEPLKRMMERIELADLVMACGTAGCVSVAMGKPTVFFSELGTPHLYPGRPAQHPHLYLNTLRFPYMADKMTIDEIMALRTHKNPRVEYWKMQNIGGNFNAQKFISVVKEYLA